MRSQCFAGDVLVLPGYAMYLIGGAMILMFLIILLLIYTLYKNSKSAKFGFITGHKSSITIDRSVLNRQESTAEVPCQNKPKTMLAECESIKIEDSFFSHSNSIRDINKSLPIASNDTDTKRRVHPILKSYGSSYTNIIDPEKMREICKNVIEGRQRFNNTNSTSSKDLSELLNVEGLERRPSGIKKSLTREKSASTPELLEIDFYDKLPTHATEKNINTNDKPIIKNNEQDSDEVFLKHSSKEKSTIKDNKKEIIIDEVLPKNNFKEPIEKPAAANEIPQIEISKEDDMEDDGDDIPIYDTLPIGEDDIPLYDTLPEGGSVPLYDTTNVVTNVKSPLKTHVMEDTQYLLPLQGSSSIESLNNALVTEPSYINANCNKYML